MKRPFDKLCNFGGNSTCLIGMFILSVTFNAHGLAACVAVRGGWVEQSESCSIKCHEQEFFVTFHKYIYAFC